MAAAAIKKKDLQADVMMLVNKKQPQVANFSSDKDYVIKEKYKLLNYLKGGAFGDVYFARHIEKNYEVAIKFVSYSMDFRILHFLFLERLKKRGGD